MPHEGGPERGGLNRHDPNIGALLTPITLYEARDGTMWVGSLPGLRRMYVKHSRRFEYLIDLDRLWTNERIRSVKEDRHGDVWIGNSQNGLLRLDRSTG